MKRRPSARLLVIDPDERTLLFQFAPKAGPRARRPFWATPGGGLEEGESFEQAARRELLEETGIAVDDVGSPVAEQRFVLQSAEGDVLAEERFFVVRTAGSVLSSRGRTALEAEVIASHRWWTLDELKSSPATIFPSDIAAIVENALARAQAGPGPAA